MGAGGVGGGVGRNRKQCTQSSCPINTAVLLMVTVVSGDVGAVASVLGVGWMVKRVAATNL